jgi:O-antigen ligase
MVQKMDGLFKIKDSLTNKISYYHLMLLLVSLPFDMFYSHLILISFAIHTLIHLKRAAIKRVFEVKTLVLQSVFFITALSTIYTLNKVGAYNEWGKQIAIFLFPLFICLNPLDLKKYRPRLLLAFSLVCTATIVYLYADAIITIRHYKLPISALFASAFTNHNFSQPINIHATFFSMQVALSLVYLLSILIKQKSLLNKLFYLMCCGILTAGLIQLSSKSVFIAIIAIINIALPCFLLQGASRRRFVWISASVSVLVVAGILSSGTFRGRYINELLTDLSLNKTRTTLDSRVARWKVSAGLIAKEPLIGYGAGSEVGLLQDGFFNHKLYSSYLNRLNTHSQYLSFMIKSGTIGLLIYLVTLTYGFKYSFRQKDLLFLTFITLIATVSLAENLLDVDKGIFFYAFFFSFFIFSQKQPEKNVVAAVKSPSITDKKSEVLV